MIDGFGLFSGLQSGSFFNGGQGLARLTGIIASIIFILIFFILVFADTNLVIFADNVFVSSVLILIGRGQPQPFFIGKVYSFLFKAKNENNGLIDFLLYLKGNCYCLSSSISLFDVKYIFELTLLVTYHTGYQLPVPVLF